MGIAKKILFIATVAAITGCSKLPIQEVNKAKTAIEAALSAESNVYASSEYADAQKKYDQAIAEIDKQNRKVFVGRNYSQAQKLLAAAENYAKSAAEASVKNKEAVKNEAQNLMTRADSALRETKALVAKAKSEQKNTTAVEQAQGKLSDSFAKLQTLFKDGDYLTVRSDAVTIIENATSLKTMVNSLAAPPKASPKKSVAAKGSKKSPQKKNAKKSKTSKKSKRN